MSAILNVDSYEYLKLAHKGFASHVITDYVYGTEFPFEDIKRICNGNIITFCSDKDHPFEPTEIAYWIKTPSTKNYKNHIGRFVERIFIYRQGKVFNQLHWSQMTGVYTDLVDSPDGHQWRKPSSLIERLIRIYTNQGDTVLDPFCGSGTVLAACQRLKREFIGMDIDETWYKYCLRYIK